MAYSPTEEAFLSRLTAVQFPDQPMEPETAPSVDGMQLAAGPSRTRSDAGAGMGEIKPIPRNKAQEALGFVGELLTKAGVQLDKYGVDIPGLGNITLKDLTVGDAGKVLEDMSYGFYPVRGGNSATGGIGTFGLKPDASMELLNVAPAAGAVAKAGVKAGVKGAMAVGRAGERLAEKTVPQIMEKGGTMAELLQAMSQGSRSQLAAYHGTPHSFDKFDASKIGTGEGAQAYGYGLYFAESKDVAKGYQMATSKDRFLAADGFFDPSEIEHLNVRAVIRRGDLDQAIAEAKKYAQPDSDYPETAAKAARDLSKLEALKSSGGIRPNEGKLITVEIPDEMVSKMLDFDKPLSQQSDYIKRVIKENELDYVPETATGGRLIEELNKAFAPEIVAKHLRDAGITGIRYLDQGSRGTGKGTRNIVVFPGGEDQVKILKQEGKK